MRKNSAAMERLTAALEKFGVLLATMPKAEQAAGKEEAAALAPVAAKEPEALAPAPAPVATKEPEAPAPAPEVKAEPAPAPVAPAPAPVAEPAAPAPAQAPVDLADVRHRTQRIAADNEEARRILREKVHALGVRRISDLTGDALRAYAAKLSELEAKAE